LKDTGLESSHGVERVDVDVHLLVVDGVRIVGGVGSSEVAAQSLEVSLGQTGANPELELFLRTGLSRWPSGMAISSEGLRNSRPFP